MSFRVLQGDCVELMAAMPAGSVDAVVCDPPYGLEFMGKDWDSLQAKGRAAKVRERRAAEVTPDGIGHTTSKGPYLAAGVDWQGVNQSAMQEWHQAWATEALRVLKPGGHLLAFGGSRTSHRLACAIEDAGFEIRDTISWLYGSGFPKSLNVGAAIDKAAGAEREVVGMGAAACEHIARGEPCPGHGDATPEAERWEGWGTALKPAHEPVVVARKPLSGTVAGNVLEHGTGALNIDGTRVGREDGDRTEYGLENGAEAGIGYHGLDGRTPYDGSGGRWPANVVLSHTEGCVQVGTRKVKSGNHGNAPGGFGKQLVGGGERQAEDFDASGGYGTETVGAWSCTPDCPVRLLDEQTGDLGVSSGGKGARSGLIDGEVYGAYSGDNKGQNAGGLGDAGGASRFFYVAKASRGERNAGLEGFEEQTVSIGDERPGGGMHERYGDDNGSGRTATARNSHPTVKPISLMRWLVRLVTPLGGTVLDPFCGSGTTGIASVLEAFDFIGLEREPEYVDIAQARIAWWHKHRGDGEAADILAAGELRDSVEATGQLGMFD